jgi:hypothetical protein
MKNKAALKIAIIGATSAIAAAVARRLAFDGHELFLIGRNKEKLAILAADLQARSQQNISFASYDLVQISQHANMIKQAKNQLAGLDIVLIAHGNLPDQKSCETSYELTYEAMHINCLSIISLTSIIANQFEQQQYGCIAVISSVAGDRGKKSNYVYGTAKAALNVFLAGLRNRLQKSNVQVLTIKPGFVDTPMTKAFKKGLLWAKPDKVAADIVKGIYKKKMVIYTPAFWRYIMLIIKSIPERFFIRLSM